MKIDIEGKKEQKAAEKLPSKMVLAPSECGRTSGK
jgi:hypothetical protein